jgi:hypothetical protein
MDQERLDRLSRVLAAPSLLSRRSALTMLGTAVLGMFVGVNADSTDAKSKSRQHANRKTRQRTRPETGHHANSNDSVGNARLRAAKRKKQGRKRGQKQGQRHGQELQGGGATTPPPDGSGGGGCESQPKERTCTGKCGLVIDTCGIEVDCGNTCSGSETCGGGGTSNT